MMLNYSGNVQDYPGKKARMSCAAELLKACVGGRLDESH